MVDFLCDIDGTVADVNHRRHFVTTKPKNWNAFNKAMVDDGVVWPVVNVVQTMIGAGNRPIFLSGRGSDFRDITTTWLKDRCSINVVPHDSVAMQISKNVFPLYMRDAKDNRRDDIVKRDLLDKVRQDGYDPTFAIDDRPQVVRMWKDIGMFVFDVYQGNGDF